MPAVLTHPPLPGHTASVPAKSGAGFDSPEAKAHNRAKRFFCARNMASALWLAVWGGREPCRSLARSVNPARSVTPFDGGVAGVTSYQLRGLP